MRNGWRRNLLVGAAVVALLCALNVYAYSVQRLVLEFVPALLIVGGMFLAATIRSLDQETMRSLAYALGIRRRDALLGSVAESSADAIMVVGPHGQIEMANAAAASMFACSRETMVGALISRYVPLPDAAASVSGAAGQGHRAGGEEERRHVHSRSKLQSVPWTFRAKRCAR